MKLKILRQLAMMTGYLFTAILLQTLFMGMLYAFPGNAQGVSIDEINIKLKEGEYPLRTVFREIIKQTNFKLSYDHAYLNENKKVYISSDVDVLGDMLRTLAREEKLSFKRVNETIFVKQLPLGSATPVVEEVVPAQVRVSGKVIEAATKEPLPGVSILIKGTSTGTTTDIDGNYSLNAAEGDVLQFSYIGFLVQEVAIGNQSTINVALEPDLEQLEEVVVIGYGTVKKSDLTGSVSSISSEQVKDLPVASFDQMLAGRAAGVQLTQASGAPGGAVSIRIRGGNSIQGGNEPLIVIDGFPIYNNNSDQTGGINFGGGGQAPNTLSSLNPADIESIEILKDASATAIYGARGANGVIMITTKRGKEGQTNVNIDSYYGVQEVANRIDMLNAQQYRDLVFEARQNSGLSTDFDLPTNVDTDWQDEIFRVAPIQSHNFSVNGGNAATKYAISANYFNQEGVVVGSDLERVSGRVNVDQKVGDKFTVGTSMLFSRQTDNVVVSDRLRGALGSALMSAPNQPAIREDGTYPINLFPNTGIAEVQNPLYVAEATDYLRNTDRLLANLYAEYEIIDNLKFRTSVGADILNNKEKYFQPANGIDYRPDGGAAIINHNNSRSFLIENTLTYTPKIGNRHNLNVVVGQTAQEYETEGTKIIAEGLNNVTTIFDLAANTRLSNNIYSTFRDWSLMSYLGRVVYGFDSKYLFTASIRADGSSRFGTGNRYGVFPSASVAWVVSKEAFLQDVEVIDNLKVRVSYGLTGNQEIGSYNSLATLSGTRAVLNNVLAQGFRPNRIPNDQLGWESTAQFNVGFDLSLFTGRLQTTFDYYNKRTDDLLYNLEVPRTTGFSSVLSNIGSVQNRGVEVTVTSFNIQKPGFEWTTDFNYSLNRNEVLDLGGQVTEFLTPFTQVRVGEPIGNFFGYQSIGLFQQGDNIADSPQPNAQPGDRRFLDLNEDGSINALDRVVLGNGLPDYLFGINNSFKIKNFDFAFFFQGVMGIDIYNRSNRRIFTLDGRQNQTAAALNRWTPQNTNTNVPRAVQNPSDRSVNLNQPISDFIEDGSFIRLQNVTLGYTLPQTALKKLGLKKLRVYAGAQNLLTITDYSGFDPEVSSLSDQTLQPSVDEFTYPRARTYLFGLNLTF